MTTWQSYRGALQEAWTQAWRRQWRSTAALIVYPFPYASLVHEPECLSWVLASDGQSWGMSIESMSMVRLRMGLVSLGLSGNGTPTKQPRAACLCCGEPGVSSLSHLVSCPANKDLHQAIEALLRLQGTEMPSSPWDRAQWTFINSQVHQHERLKYVTELEHRLVEASRAARTNSAHK